MSNVVDIESAKPHWSGECVCTGCKHEWVAVAPMDADKDTLECPECSRYLGVTKGPFIPGVAWECNCGSQLFYLSAEGPVCRHCGNLDVDWMNEVLS